MVKQEAELRAQLKALQADKAALADSLAATETQLEALRSQQQNTLAQFASTQTALADTRSAWDATQQSLAQRDKSLALCQDQNQGYFHINRELLQRFESTVAQLTPWYLVPWQFDRVALENEGLVIRDQMEERKLQSDPATR